MKDNFVIMTEERRIIDGFRTARSALVNARMYAVNTNETVIIVDWHTAKIIATVTPETEYIK